MRRNCRRMLPHSPAGLPLEMPLEIWIGFLVLWNPTCCCKHIIKNSVLFSCHPKQPWSKFQSPSKDNLAVQSLWQAFDGHRWILRGHVRKARRFGVGRPNDRSKGNRQRNSIINRCCFFVVIGCFYALLPRVIFVNIFSWSLMGTPF